MQRPRSAPWIPLLALLVVFLPSRAAEELSFSGVLERIGQASISLKLSDGRVIDARLRSASADSRYRIGDGVRIRCKTIERTWEEDTARYQYLAVTGIESTGPPSSHAAPAAGAGLPGNRMTSEGRAELDDIRDINLAYADHMPNFVADETATRYTSGAAPVKWRYADTIQTEITFSGDRAVRRQIRRNKKAWDKPFEALPGFKWYGGFGTEIRPIFDSRCPTEIARAGTAELRGKHAIEYQFNSPADGCFTSFFYEYQRYNPARSGHVFIEQPGGHVLQFDEDATEFPGEFPFAERHEEVRWDYVKIGGDSHLLPVAANFVAVYPSGTRERVEVEYTNHRHFESSTNMILP